MADVTTNYSLPYQELGDPPDGASLGEDLATALDTILTRMDTVPNVQPFLTAGTFSAGSGWQKPAGARWVRAQVWGAGGGSGAFDGAVSGQGESGGGGGGGYAEKIFAASALTAQETVVVGAAGAGGTGGTGAGAAGGSSSFDSISATGGGGGASGAPGTVASASGEGGDGTGGDLNVSGSAGGNGRVISTLAVLGSFGGGAGRGGGAKRTPTGAGAGGNGKPPGGGASGAFGTTTDQLGGNGSAGRVIVTTYF